MKKRFALIFTALVALLFLFIPFANAEVTVSVPENVILSLTGDTTEMAVTCRDVAEVAVGQVRYGRRIFPLLLSPGVRWPAATIALRR